MSKSNAYREARKYIYGVAIASIPFLVHFNVIDVEASVIAVPLLMALLNLTPKEAKEIEEAYRIDFGEDQEPVEVTEDFEIDETQIP